MLNWGRSIVYELFAMTIVLFMNYMWFGQLTKSIKFTVTTFIILTIYYVLFHKYICPT